MKLESIKNAQQFNKDRFTKIDMIKTRRSVTFLLNFLPGQHMKPHNHPSRELYLHVLEGDGTFTFDGEELEVAQGDVIYCDPEEKLGFTNTGNNPVSIYATMTKMKD